MRIRADPDPGPDPQHWTLSIDCVFFVRYEHVYTRDVCRKFLQNRCHNRDCMYDHITEDEMEVFVNV